MKKMYSLFGFHSLAIMVILLSACTPKIPSTDVVYDSEIPNQIKSDGSTRVLVLIYDHSNISISPHNLSKDELVRLRHEWFQNQVNELIPQLPENDVTDIRIRAEGFSAEVNLEGFVYLLSRPEIRNIESTAGPKPELSDQGAGIN